jgi:hypothetical protein
MALNLPTLAELRAKPVPCPKGESRLQVKAQAIKDESKEERGWKREIWTRDGGKCRWCKRKVVKTLELLPNRGECHHLEPRENRVTRWDRRNGLLTCCSCHERLTGKVNERHVLIPTKFFVVDGVSYGNADYAVRFKRVV